MALSVRFRNQRSTRFSHELDVGVKCRWNRGWVASHLATPGWVWVAQLSYLPYARRIWQLRHDITCYDAWYVAVAELLSAPLATLDHRLIRATGPRCAFVIPPT
ncbi:hypothetical protein BH20ACT8_BH20ACT8_03040 [soil metagenome]